MFEFTLLNIVGFSFVFYGGKYIWEYFDHKRIDQLLIGFTNQMIGICIWNFNSWYPIPIGFVLIWGYSYFIFKKLKSLSKNDSLDK